ncbi:MAG: hypothetical protein ACRDVM_05930 [Acidimicrobiia bacterium]
MESFEGAIYVCDGNGVAIDRVLARLERRPEGDRTAAWGGTLTVSAGSALSAFGSYVLLRFPDGVVAEAVLRPFSDEREPDPAWEFLEVVGMGDPPF